MIYAKTTALKTIQKWTRRFRVAQGGASAGKTIAILLFLIDYAMRNENKLISVTSRTYPHLRAGAMRDFKNILREQNLEDWFSASLTTSTWTYTPNGTQIEFFGADDASKVRGPRRDVLFVNEANLLSWDTFDQLATRTRDFNILDYNPTAEFWAHTELLKHYRDETDFAIFTYRDNEALSANERQAIEAHDHNSNWWRVYGEGQIGELENNIFKGWLPIDDLPSDAELENYGLDFGFEHPTALVAVYKDKLGYIFDEKLYESHLTPEQIVAQVGELVGDSTVLCDSARPEIIEQLRANNVRAISANKNQGSVLRGIGEIQDLKDVRYIGKNLEREYLSYAWREKADGTKIEEPVKMNDDAMDAIRYAVDDLVMADNRDALVASDLAEYDKLDGNYAGGDIFSHDFYK